MEANISLYDKLYNKVCVLAVKAPQDNSTKDRQMKVLGTIGGNILQKIFKGR